MVTGEEDRASDRKPLLAGGAEANARGGVHHKPGLVMKPFTLTLLTSRVPGGGGGGLGYAPPLWFAAILRGDPDYRFTWTLRDLGAR